MDTSYLSQQVASIVSQLHGLFDDIGVPSHERDARESEVRNTELERSAEANAESAFRIIVQDPPQPCPARDEVSQQFRVWWREVLTKWTSEKNELIEKAQHIITTIRQLELSLEDEPQGFASQRDNGLEVTVPLLDCLRNLEEKHDAIRRLHQERFEEIKSK